MWQIREGTNILGLIMQKYFMSITPLFSVFVILKLFKSYLRLCYELWAVSKIALLEQSCCFNASFQIIRLSISFRTDYLQHILQPFLTGNQRLIRIADA